jgi:uncharacterized membrane protein YidH (DUF202 family)
MKKIPIALGYFTFFFTALYAVFKFIRIPGAANIMLIAGLLMSIYFPLLFLKQLQKRYDKKFHFVYKFGAFLLSIIILSLILGLHHWRVVMYQDNQIITLFRFSPWIYIAAVHILSLVFIPILLYINYKDDKDNLLKNLVGGLGLAMIPISLVGFHMHWPYHQHLFIIGNILFVLIYLPWHILSFKKERREFDNIFKTLIIAYILILFLYGIFLKWPVTYQDVLNGFYDK